MHCRRCCICTYQISHGSPENLCYCNRTLKNFFYTAHSSDLEVSRICGFLEFWTCKSQNLCLGCPWTSAHWSLAEYLENILACLLFSSMLLKAAVIGHHQWWDTAPDSNLSCSRQMLLGSSGWCWKKWQQQNPLIFWFFVFLVILIVRGNFTWLEEGIRSVWFIQWSV